MANKFLTKADIFKTAEKAFEPQVVTVDEWGGDIKFRPMSMNERREVRKKSVTPGTDESGAPTQEVDQELMELWAIITCVLDPSDDSGQRFMFGPEDIGALENKIASGPLSTISIAVLKASGLGPTNFREGKDEAKKGS